MRLRGAPLTTSIVIVQAYGVYLTEGPFLRSIVIAAIAAFAFANSAGAAIDSYMTFSLDAHGKCHDAHGHFASAEKCRRPPPHCDKGKPCGDTCIPKDKVCHIR